MSPGAASATDGRQQAVGGRHYEAEFQRAMTTCVSLTPWRSMALGRSAAWRAIFDGAAPVLIAVASGVAFWLSWSSDNDVIGMAGAAGVLYLLARLDAWARQRRQRIGKLRTRTLRVRPVAACKAIAAGDSNALAELMLAQGRCALLLRPQISAGLSGDQFQRALQAFDQSMSLVPEGAVTLQRDIDCRLGLAGGQAQSRPACEVVGEETPVAGPRTVRLTRFFIDRYAVTNAQYYEFVEAGGYQQIALWAELIWPAVLDFVDSTGKPGPRGWRDGCYLPGEEKLPVVGVSWYEASACARWLGKRLPSDAEWVKAGSWPVPVAATAHAQRKYPWGDAMDHHRANLWGSGAGAIVPVDAFAEGASVGGVHQLIGNVWEWTAGNFRGHELNGDLMLPTAMKSIRGGAFDTYFDNQATCHFQSGENPLRRRHNIGFRCAVGACDLLLARKASTDVPPAE
jgi:gamma-glutamyl hercynylcysteine S-oxide synthase